MAFALRKTILNGFSHRRLLPSLRFYSNQIDPTSASSLQPPKVPGQSPYKTIADISVGEFHLDTIDESFQRTTISCLQKDLPTGHICLDSFSNYGFRLSNNAFLFGPVAAFPRTVLSWRVLSPAEITEESLEFLTMLEPKLDIVVIGAGDAENVADVRQKVLPLFRKHHIGIEVLPTDRACELFNFLNSERRYVAACLFPPQQIETSRADSIESANRFGISSEPEPDPFFGSKTKNILELGKKVMKLASSGESAVVAPKDKSQTESSSATAESSETILKQTRTKN